MRVQLFRGGVKMLQRLLFIFFGGWGGGETCRRVEQGMGRGEGGLVIKKVS